VSHSMQLFRLSSADPGMAQLDAVEMRRAAKAAA